MKVSVGIVAYNEEKNLPRILGDLIKQTFPHDQIEVVLVDSRSEDGTRDLMQKFAGEHKKEFSNIQVVDNPKRRQSCGWNCAIQAFTTEALIRVDAHSSIPPEFVAGNVAALEEGEMVTGGVRPNIVAAGSSHCRELYVRQQRRGISPGGEESLCEVIFSRSLPTGSL